MNSGKLVWHAIRTFTFYLIGAMNTIMIRPEDVGTFKNYLGYVLLVLAVADTVYGVKMWLKLKQGVEDA